MKQSIYKFEYNFFVMYFIDSFFLISQLKDSLKHRDIFNINICLFNGLTYYKLIENWFHNIYDL